MFQPGKNYRKQGCWQRYEATVLRCRLPEKKLSLDRTRSGTVDFHPKYTGVYEAPLRMTDGRLRLRAFLDTSSVEVFTDDGETSLTSLVLPQSGPRALRLESVGNDARIKSLEIWELKPAVR